MSILLAVLRVPGHHDPVDDFQSQVDARAAAGTELRLPISTVVETGDHIVRIEQGHERRRCAKEWVALLEATLEEEAPWTFRPVEWDASLLRVVLEPTPELDLVESLAVKHLEMGDVLLLAEMKRLRVNLGRFVDVDLWTTDEALRAEPRDCPAAGEPAPASDLA